MPNIQSGTSRPETATEVWRRLADHATERERSAYQDITRALDAVIPTQNVSQPMTGSRPDDIAIPEPTDPVSPSTRFFIPEVMLFNASEKRQRRWVDVALPWRLSEGLPDHCWFHGDTGNFYAVRGHAIGRHSRMWSIYADIEGLSRSVCIEAAPALPMAGTSHPDVSAQLVNSNLSVRLECDGGPLPSTTILSFKSALREAAVDSAHLSRIMFKDSRRGFHLTGEIRMRSWSPVADFDISVVWSDRSTPVTSISQVLIKLQSEGCLLHMDLPNCRGFLRSGDMAYQATRRERFVDGSGFRVTGTLIFNPAINLGDMQQAAMSGKILSSCWWSSEFMALSETRTFARERPTPAELRARRNELFNAAGVSLYYARPYANAPFAGQTGDQEPFGAQKCVHLLTNPVEALLVNVSCDDLWMRGFHHREGGGARLRFNDHPEWRTFEGVTHYATSADTLGKAKPLPTDMWYQSDAGNGRLVFLDDQHRGDKYLLACYAMTGSYVLLESILDLIETDKARAFRRTGQLDAPRASGRLWQSWADMVMVLPHNGPAKVEVIGLAMEELAKLEAHDDSMGDRVPWMWSVRSRNYLNNEFDVAFPWQETLAVLGAEAMGCALYANGHHDDFARMWRWTQKHAIKLMRYGVVRDITGGREHPVMAAIYDSSLWPSDYMRADREGVAFESASGVNLQIGTDGWFDWFSSIIMLCRNWLGRGPSNENDEIISRAVALYERFGHGGEENAPIHSLEWWAIPGGGS